jgi:hypothetical protein
MLSVVAPEKERGPSFNEFDGYKSRVVFKKLLMIIQGILTGGG